MSDHPSTFSGKSEPESGIEWDDHATIHAKEDGQGLFDSLKALHRGTLAEMVAHIAALPETERSRFVIQKAGDHRLEPAEIMQLAGRADFPHKA